MGILSFIVTLFGGILAGIVVTILVVYLINELMDTPKWLIGLMGLFLLPKIRKQSQWQSQLQ